MVETVLLRKPSMSMRLYNPNIHFTHQKYFDKRKEIIRRYDECHGKKSHTAHRYTVCWTCYDYVIKMIQ